MNHRESIILRGIALPVKVGGGRDCPALLKVEWTLSGFLGAQIGTVSGVTYNFLGVHPFDERVRQKRD